MLKRIKKNKQGLAPIKYRGESMLNELCEHRDALDHRIASASFAHYVVTTEHKKWAELAKQAGQKAKLSTGKTKTAAEKLRFVAITAVGKYSEREPKLTEIVDELVSTQQRLVEAINSIEIDHNLQAVTSMLDITGEDLLDNIDFNMETESRRIRELLHSTDALLELEQ